MRKAIILLSTLALAATAVTAQAAPKRSERGEAELAKALAGRVAGPPVNCINLRDIRSSRIYDGTAIVYEVGNTLYVNRPSGASFLRRDDITITDTHSSQLCSVDIVRTMDAMSRIPGGTVGLNKFVPYKKPKA